jgi:predicted unusual protein kinase regulating ubiquinone biosynthesis (AarF/ABC1/UbiB family)
MSDTEQNRLAARAARYARVGANVGGVAARIAGARLFGQEATIPDALPPEYADALQKLQNDAPPMGAAFVKRRMQAELGADWTGKFAAFDLRPAAAASLGQVHRATSTEGEPLACKLQYPDMRSAVEADLSQLRVLFSIHRRMNPAVDLREAMTEIGDRLREELDYRQEAKHAALYRLMLADTPEVSVPTVHDALTTERLLTMGWLQGDKLLTHKDDDLDARNRIGRAMFKAWWYPFSHYGVIHGDPHFGNYTVRSTERDGRPTPDGINLLDYGCIRVFPPRFVGGVVDLYNGLLHEDRARVVHAYETWGFKGLSKKLIDILNIWARFIYGPILDDRVRTIADGVEPGQYGRREAFAVHKQLKEHGPVKVPREFVFMDRAAVGLGGVFLHLRAEMNFYRLFNEQIGNFDLAVLARRQAEALSTVGMIREN